eukprot:4286827-Pleurochrysis_carterae.AAC.2
MKGSSEDNEQYTSKGGESFSAGECPKIERGKRSDLDKFKNAVQGGNLNMKRLREEYSQVYSKYARFCEAYVRDNMPAPEFEDHPLRPWQLELQTTLQEPPNARKVIFVPCTAGNSGKTWFASYWS